jgi:superfamily II DNA or RNA helicase
MTTLFPATAKLELRPYQQEAIAAVEALTQYGPARPVLEMATGLGKTVIFAEIARRRGPRAIILVHRDELVSQTMATLEKVWPDVLAGVVQADDDEHDADVVVASVQSLREKRLHRWAPGTFKTLIVDESHHATAPTYRRVIDWLQAPLVLGVTATPYRGDRMTIAGVFTDGVAYSYAAPAGIRDGWLCEAVGYRPGTDVLLDGVATRSGDFEEAALTAVIDTYARNLVAVESVKRYAPGRRTIAFTASVDHAHHLAQVFRQEGISAAAVDGGMPKHERRETLARFKAGDLKVICNCAVLTEGYDDTSVSCILLAKPTKALGLWTQMVGRGLRKAPGKTDCVVIDLADTTSRHKLVGMHTLIGSQKPVRDGVKLTVAVEEAEREKQPWMLFARSLHKTSEVDIKLYSEAATKAAHAGDRPEDSYQEIWDEISQLRDFDPEGDDLLWMATEPQRKALEGFGWPHETVVQATRKEASMALDRLHQMHTSWVRERVPIIALALGMTPQAVADELLGKESGLWRLHAATDKQMSWLRWKGLTQFPTLTKGEASLVIDKLRGGGGEH